MERAQRRKYHYIYKTTCIITNKFYIGMHSTDNLEDGYIGSGKRLWYSINKHGKDNHVCEILEFLPDRNSLKVREMEIVNEELLNEELCLNLSLGGEGGYHGLNSNQGGDKWKAANNLWEDPVYKKHMSNLSKERWEDPGFREKQIQRLYQNKYRLGKSHSEETKRKIGEANSIKQKGSNNSQYGKCWITNETESKKINKGDTIPEGWRLGRKLN